MKQKNREREKSKPYCELRFTASEKLIDSKLAALDLALNLAKEQNEVRLNHLNEFRQALMDQTSEYVTKVEHDTLRFHYDQEIKTLNESRNYLAGKASQSSVYVAYALGITSLIVSIVVMVLKFIK